jgi:hypothetical protein
LALAFDEVVLAGLLGDGWVVVALLSFFGGDEDSVLFFI